MIRGVDIDRQMTEAMAKHRWRLSCDSVDGGSSPFELKCIDPCSEETHLACVCHDIEHLVNDYGVVFNGFPVRVSMEGSEGESNTPYSGWNPAEPGYLVMVPA